MNELLNTLYKDHTGCSNAYGAHFRKPLTDEETQLLIESLSICLRRHTMVLTALEAIVWARREANRLAAETQQLDIRSKQNDLLINNSK